MNNMIPTALLIGLVACPASVLAQSDIPASVIAECNAQGRASSLPDCLKSGATAYEMLEFVRGDALYGVAAEPVIEACEERNETFQMRWLCFRGAAQSAAETRQLIGVENIGDRCVAGISAPGLLEEIEATFTRKREARYPDKLFFGGDLFYAFQGCAEQAEEAAMSSGDAANDTEDAGRSSLDARACSAYAEMKGLIASNDAAGLRELGARMNALDDPTSDQFAETFGLERDTADYFLEEDADQQMMTLTLLGAFIYEHHGELLFEILKTNEATLDNPAAEMGEEMARGFLLAIIEGARGEYIAGCSPS